jgi:drug/metabolite transporter (DMT)-like permease
MTQKEIPMSQTPSRMTYLAFIATMIIGGTNFIAVSFSNQELPPLFGATIRFSLATILFFLIAWGMRLPLLRGRSLKGAAFYGFLNVGTAYAFLYTALLDLTAGMVSAIVSSVPLFTLTLAVIFGQEHLSTRRVIGGILAIIGIVIMSLGGVGGDFSLPYFGAALLGAVSIAASTVVAKAYPEVHPVNMNAVGGAVGTLLLAVISLIMGERWELPQETATWLSVGWLTIIGSVGLFTLFLFVVKRWSASATAYATTGMPVIAAGLGVVMLSQPITVELIVGGALVIIAVYFGAIHK